MEQDNQGLLKRLHKPLGPVDVVIDTDTFNEVDDQYALAFLIKLQDKLRLKAIYAAPFLNKKSTGPGDGMEKSYTEIMNILALMKREDLKSLVKEGSRAFLSSETEPVDSPAARSLAELAMTYSEDTPLYVIAIGAITNIASALLLKPEIKERIVVIWLGGHAFHWPENREFNLSQDVAAARIIFECGVPVVLLPCMGVVSSFATTSQELEYWLRGKNELCDYLVNTTIEHIRESQNIFTVEYSRENQNISTWAKVIWDVTAVAWLLEGDYMLDRLEPSPIPQYDHHYSFDKRRHFIRYVYHINRAKLFELLFKKLTEEPFLKSG
jgi:inosine-uridine nucleoside N-ribohydrolase